MDVTSNLFLGNEHSRFGFLKKKAMNKKAEELLQNLDIRIPDVTIPVGNLSGGQRLGVAVARLVNRGGKVFIFDEPTTGLHFHDIRKLLEAFDALILRGHSIVIIEHNMDVIKCADYVIDLGPEGGDKGGNLVAAGTPEEVAKCATSYTGQFLQEKLHMK